MSRTFAAVALISATALAYPTTEQRASVKVWDDLMVKYGYDYELYKVQTEDQWELSLFRIIGKAGSGSNASTKPPVLVMHGSEMDAASWISYYFMGVPMPMQLVEEGYDVWMGNNRGTRYSNVNPKFPRPDDPTQNK